MLQAKQADSEAGLAKRQTPSRLHEQRRKGWRDRAYADLQGLVLSGYRHMCSACFLFLEIANARRCRRWLRETLPQLTTAARRPRAERRASTCLNVAFTRAGLERLGLSDEVIHTFPPEFREGMARRAAVLGDTGESAPAGWEFGGDGQRKELHALLMLYAPGDGALDELLGLQRARLAEGGLEVLHCQPAAHAPGSHGYFAEPFGFRDGISQPVIEGFERPRRHDLPAIDRPVRAGEFILGYRNEYGQLPESPSVPREEDGGGVLQPVPGEGERRDLGRHGSYLVLRKLRQDVEGFWRFANGQAQAAGVAPEWIAAKLVGRWPNGAPLREADREQPSPDDEVDNSFLFTRGDPHGYGCPMTSHIRRCNPRDSLPPDASMSLQAVRRHRLLRRGLRYSGPGDEQGLMFIALNANLRQQFEFIQQNWINDEKFGGHPDEPDPLVGAAGRPGTFTIPRCPVRHRLHDLPRFVQTRGGAYFFLPSRSALEFLANLRRA